MVVTILETYGVIQADGTLHLTEKLAVAPGRVRVCVESIYVPDTEFAERFAALVSKADMTIGTRRS
ncbi:MAG: hypothetical protein EXS16_06365 [Gemmataceae bacterium]|nr:hypothetical protein [Gemmataceae bacterium]